MAVLRQVVFVCLLIVGSVAQSTDDAPTESDGVFDIMGLVVDKLSRAASSVGGFSDPEFSMLSNFKSLSPSVVQGLVSSCPLGLKMHLAPVLAASPDRWEKSMVIGREYVHSHPDLMTSLAHCITVNVSSQSNSSCDLESTLWHAWQNFEDETGLTHHTGMGTRPSATGFAKPSSFLRFLFWITLAIFHIRHPMVKLQEWAAKLLTATSSAIDKTDIRTKDSIFEDAQLSRWYTIMSVFPTFDQFKRAYQQQPEYRTLLMSLCSSTSNGAQGIVGEPGESTMEACWATRQLQIAKSGRQTRQVNEFLGVPLSVDYMIFVFAICAVATQPRVFPTESCNLGELGADWICSAASQHNSICILVCENKDGKIRKIDSSKSNIVACSGSNWVPEAAKRATCVEKNAAQYDYGVNRGIDWRLKKKPQQ